jgi:hypothetical protein
MEQYGVASRFRTEDGACCHGIAPYVSMAERSRGHGGEGVRTMSRIPIAACVLLSVLIFCAQGLLISGLVEDWPAPAPTGDDAVEIAELLLILILWFLLAVLLIICGLAGRMPWWSAMIAVIVLPVSGVATISSSLTLREWGATMPPYRWPIVVPMLIPPIVVIFGFWSVLPGVRSRISARVAAGGCWGMILVLCVTSLMLLRAHG